MNELLVKRIYNSMIGKKLISDSEMLQLKSAIDEFVGNRDGNHYLVLDDGYECVNYDTMRNGMSQKQAKSLWKVAHFKVTRLRAFTHMLQLKC